MGIYKFYMEFLKEIKERLGEHDPSQIDELVLDELFSNISEFTSDHKNTLELYTNLLHLSLNGMGLKNLNNFPKIETLEVLEIIQIESRENPIKSLDVFKCFAYTKLNKMELRST